MPEPRVRIETAGVPEAVRALHTVYGGCEAIGLLSTAVGSPLPYAYGMETGRHKSGRLARRAGGAHYLEGAMVAVQEPYRKVIVAALPQGEVFTEAATNRLGETLVREAQSRAPVRSGALRSSIRVRPLGRLSGRGRSG